MRPAATLVAPLAGFFSDCAAEIVRVFQPTGNNVLICSLNLAPATATQILEAFYVRPTSIALMLAQITAGTLAIQGVFERTGTRFRYVAAV
jgi:hypothetical protein